MEQLSGKKQKQHVPLLESVFEFLTQFIYGQLTTIEAQKYIPTK